MCVFYLIAHLWSTCFSCLTSCLSGCRVERCHTWYLATLDTRTREEAESYVGSVEELYWSILSLWTVGSICLSGDFHFLSLERSSSCWRYPSYYCKWAGLGCPAIVYFQSSASLSRYFRNLVEAWEVGAKCGLQELAMCKDILREHRSARSWKRLALEVASDCWRGFYTLSRLLHKDWSGCWKFSAERWVMERVCSLGQPYS